MTGLWRMAKSLEVLRHEIDARWPGRDTTSDGGIGDAEHASRHSDHNPWIHDHTGLGVVRARDVDEDLTPDDPMACEAIVDHIVELGRGGDDRLNPDGYVIYEGRIWSSQHGWRERPYTGENAHRHHAHISVTTREAGYDDERSWGVAHISRKPAGLKRDRWLGLSNPPMTGPDVAGVRNALRVAGNHDLPTGDVYDRQTTDLIALFQKRRGIAERGVGPQTWAALRAVVHQT